MPKFTIYDTSSGNIVRSGIVPSELLADQIQQAGRSILRLGISDAFPGRANDYISGGVVTVRPDFSAITVNKAAPVNQDDGRKTISMLANGTDTCTFSTIPALIDDDVSMIVGLFRDPSVTTYTNPSSQDLTFSTAGKYIVTFDAFPYKDDEYIINAT